MGTQKQRRILPPMNKYQERITLLTFIPGAFILLILVFSLFIVKRQAHMAYHADFVSAYMQFAFRWHEYIIGGICAVFIIAVVSAFILSKDLVEPFPRVIAELDEIIAHRSKKLITVRPSDELANELLKRVNVLIKSYIEKGPS